MFKISVGSSTDPDTAEAVGELIAQCLARFGSATPKAGILFNIGHEHDRTVLQAIADTWPQMCLIGSACGPATGEKRLTLMLLDSGDLQFRVGIGRQARLNPNLAAEQALSQAAESAMDRILMCLTLPDVQSDWNQDFDETMEKLLPRGTAWLNELLPYDKEQSPRSIDRYYSGREVLRESVPILVAIGPRLRTSAPGWSLTRQQGIVRRELGEQVYEYDTLIGDRRRRVRVG